MTVETLTDEAKGRVEGDILETLQNQPLTYEVNSEQVNAADLGKYAGATVTVKATLPAGGWGTAQNLTKTFEVGKADKALDLAFPEAKYSYVYGTTPGDKVPTAADILLKDTGLAVGASNVEVKVYAKEDWNATTLTGTTPVTLDDTTGAGEYIAVATWAAGQQVMDTTAVKAEDIAKKVATVPVTVEQADAGMKMGPASYPFGQAFTAASDVLSFADGVTATTLGDKLTVSIIRSEGGFNSATDNIAKLKELEGTFEVTATLSGHKNYKDATVTGSFTISKDALVVDTSAVTGTTVTLTNAAGGLGTTIEAVKAAVKVTAPGKTENLLDVSGAKAVLTTVLTKEGSSTPIKPEDAKEIGTYDLHITASLNDAGKADDTLKNLNDTTVIVKLSITKDDSTAAYTVENKGNENPSITYDGKDHPVSEFAKGAYDSDGAWKAVTVYESLTGGAKRPLSADEFSWVVTKGGQTVSEIKDAGTYTISAVIPDTATAKETVVFAYTVTVNTAKVTITYTQEAAPYNAQKDWTEEAQDKANVTVTGVNGETLPTDKITVTVAKENAPGQWYNGKVVNAGKHAVTVVWPADAKYPNYAATTLNTNFVVDPTPGTTLTLNDKTVTYTGAAQAIDKAVVNNGVAGDAARISYTYVSADKKTTVTDPKGVVDAGVWTVTAVLPDQGNRAGATATATFTVEKATPEITIGMKDMAYEDAKDNGVEADADVTFSSNVDLAYAWTFNGAELKDVTGKALPATTDTLEKAANDKDAGKVDLKPGTYEVTVTATPKTDDAKNLNEASASKSITVRDAKNDPARLPKASDAASASVKTDITYGDDLSKVEFNDATNSSANGLAGTWRINVPEGTQATKLGSLGTVELVFVPSDANYAESAVDKNNVKYTVSGLTVVAATLDKEAVVIDTYTGKFDGKAHQGILNVTVNGKVEGDTFNLSYSKNGGDWTNKLSEITYTDAGTYTVYVKVNGGSNYVEKTYTAEVKITKSSDALAMNPLTTEYSQDKTSFQPKVYIGGEEVPAKYLIYTYALWNADTKKLSYSLNANSLTATEDGKPYYVKATLNPDAKNGIYNSYDLAEDFVVSTVAISKADFPAADYKVDIAFKNSGTADKPVYPTYKYDGSKASVAIKEGDLEKKVASGNAAGTWDFDDKDQILEVGSEVVMVYNFANTLDQKGYNKYTVTLKPDVEPMALKTDPDVKLSAESVPFGTDPAEVVISAEGKVYSDAPTNKKELAGTWKLNVDELEIGTKEYPVVYVAESGARNYNVTKKDGTAYTVTLKVTKGDPELKLSDTSKLYDGTAAAVTVESKSDAKVDLTWYDAAGKQLDRAPINPGKYSVQASVQETTKYMAQKVKADYTIEYNDHYFGVEGFVTRLYSVALGREPEQEGYTKWVNGMKSKEYTPEFVSYGFIFSKEFTNKKYDNATFLKIMYSTFMDREPDASGYNMWLNGLNSGEFSREDVFQGFVKSREFTNICARYGL